MFFFVQGNLQSVEQTTTQQQQQDYRSSPPTPDEVQWSYTDPQGKVQGKSGFVKKQKNQCSDFFPPKDIKKRSGFCVINI